MLNKSIAIVIIEQFSQKYSEFIESLITIDTENFPRKYFESIESICTIDMISQVSQGHTKNNLDRTELNQGII